MKRILFVLLIACVAETIVAQPASRREEQQKAAQKSNANNMTTRAQISFPTQAPMQEDVVWRRDIYRELDLNEDANAGLYYPVEPVGTQMNLFTNIFKLVMRRAVPAYEYRLDGNEVFTDDAKVKQMSILDNYHIYYERTDKGIHIDDSDIPSREVTGYYIKESAYYDQATATFHNKVLALCPIMKREDDFGDGTTNYPMFWVQYDDLAPYLAKQTIMTSNLNNAATMSVDDYFTKNMYRGKIYKTTNMLGKSLSQITGGSDSLMTKEQKRIESELLAFEKNIWGKPENKDSLDSIANLDKKELRALKKQNRRAGGNQQATKTVKTRRGNTTRTSSASSSARVTVRRERH